MQSKGSVWRARSDEDEGASVEVEMGGKRSSSMEAGIANLTAALRARVSHVLE